MLPSIGIRSVKTSGQSDRTSAHSTGLSSRKMKLSTPRFSSWASERMLSDLDCQLIRQGPGVSLQDHVRAPIQDGKHVGLVILAAQTEQESLAPPALS